MADTGPARAALMPAIPILRMTNTAQARAFYVGWLGFAVEFEHRFAPHMPLYLGIRRDELVMHLSEHRGDGVPGVAVFLPLGDVRALRTDLLTRPWPVPPPPIQAPPWGLTLDLTDPSGNQLRFCERVDAT